METVLRCWPFAGWIHWLPVDSPQEWPVTWNFDVFIDEAVEQTMEFPVIWDAMWRRCNKKAGHNKYIILHHLSTGIFQNISCIPHAYEIIVIYIYIFAEKK